MIDGPNEGLVHSVSITEDQFATGSNKTLVNHKPYYFMVVAYAALPGHREVEYLAGRRIEQFSVIPHKSEPLEGGIKLNGGYGDGPKLVRLEGTGNGGIDLELTQKTKDEIMAFGKVDYPEYEIGQGPVNVKIVDPLKVPQGEFELIMLEDASQTTPLGKLDGLVANATNWILVNKTTNDTVYSDYTIDYENEQLITAQSTQDQLKDWGLSVTLTQVVGPGNADVDESNGLIGWDVEWEDNSKQWLTAIPDIDNGAWYNWIRSGREGRTEATPDYSLHDYRDADGESLDQFEVYEKIWDGRIAPYRLASKNIPANASPQPERNYTLVQGVAYQGTQPPAHWFNLDNLASVDLVITPDESKWSQCLVLEMGEEAGLNQGGAEKFEIRKHNSIN